MKLSVIIVNYNVRYFLEQCLASVFKALQGLDGEVIVVDNASVDDSVDMVRKKFPSTILISSPSNLGFSKANNVGFRSAKGEYVLLLNPDTLVEEDCFKKCLHFMELHPQAGALGVKMLDGSGKVLPESKRGFPGLWASFCKMSGLYRLFPKSALFNHYYLGHLDASRIQEIDVLSGAFMFMPSNVYAQMNGLDEEYFMYGEDIDLSYRIQRAGYKNYYFPGTSIIHFKGESTSKASLNYYMSFYKAMIIFSKKHLKSSNPFFFLLFLKILIGIKAFISSIKNFLGTLSLALIDALFLGAGFVLIRSLWAQWYHGNWNYFDNQVSVFNTLLFILIWVSCFYYQGVYEKKYALKDVMIAAISGFALNLMMYALLPEYWRSSRMLLVFSFIWVIGYMLTSRLLINKFKRNLWTIVDDREKNALVLGDQSQYERVLGFFSQMKSKFHVNFRSPSELVGQNRTYWLDYLRICNIDELIFCEKNMNWKDIFEVMGMLQGKVDFKILSEAGQGIIGSSSKHSRGEIYTFELDHNLGQKVYQRQKRLFDICFSLILFLFSWLLIFMYKKRMGFINNCWLVLKGTKTWVSYQDIDVISDRLPMVKPGICSPVPRELLPGSRDVASQWARHYAWNYSVWTDFDICLRDFQNLDMQKNGANSH